jgi:glycosyltransferase involved in cell wall biosynthesis
VTDAPRILLYTDASFYGGAEAALGILLGELDRGLDMAVAGVDAEVVERVASQRPGTPVHLLPAARTKRDASNFGSTLVRLRALRPLIFQANLPVPSSARYALAAAVLVRGVRTMAVEHLPYRLDGALQIRLKRFTSRRLAAHVAVGHRVARDVESFVGLPEGSVQAIHNGVPDLELEPTTRNGDRLVVGSVGRLDRQKGLDVLLRALVDVPEARLVLVGDGDERGSLESLTAELGLSERVRFAGWSDDPRRALASFDVFVLPSRFEGFPLAIVEAMLARLPVVATDVGSVREAVVDGDTGLLVPPEDPEALAMALRALLNDAERRAVFGARGRERALVFSPAAMARAYERVYQEILR